MLDSGNLPSTLHLICEDRSLKIANESLERNGLIAGPAAASVGFLDVTIDVEVACLNDCRHGYVLVGLPQEASSVLQEYCHRHGTIQCR